MKFTSFPYPRVQKQQKNEPNGPKLTLPQKGQGQPSVMINTNFVELPTLMLRTKFQGNCPSCSGIEDFYGFEYFSMTTIM